MRSKTSRPVRDKSTKPVVAIGGSAGSLEAIENFFRNMPPDSGMSFIVITHLDPKQKSLLPEILRNYTAMKVDFALDGVKLKPDNVYIKPPDKDLSILHGTFRLFDLPLKGGSRLTIDAFLTDLAEDQKDKCAAVILSGTGTDGSLGIKAVKENFGMVLVQDLKDAKFDGMPQSAVDTGVADFVLPAGEIPEVLINYFKSFSVIQKGNLPATEKDESSLDKIFILIRKQTGNDFSLYKKNTIYRRVERRMSINMINSISEYVRYLQKNSAEVDLLFKELLIGVTEFFRDLEAFEFFRKSVLPALFKVREKEGMVRIWVAGCSTGEEAYSIAICIQDFIKKTKQYGNFKPQIFATDINTEAIEYARHGIYPQNIANMVPRDKIDEYFVKEDNKYRVKKEIREMIVFSKQNVIMDPPLTKIDLISCRNMLIYLNSDIQSKLLSIFHYSLNQEGVLFLGTSESTGTQGELFSNLNSKWKFFRRRTVSTKTYNFTGFNFITPYSNLKNEVPSGEGKQDYEINFSDLTHKLLLDKFTPPSILINDQGDIIYIHGRTGNYLEPAAGKVNMNLFAMAREGLKYELGQGIRKALAEKKEIILNELELKILKSKIFLNVILSPVTAPVTKNSYLLVIFQEFEPVVIKERDIIKMDRLNETKTIENLKKELKYTKENLQDTVEEMTSAQEEQKSANEELQSINEELQSTNEELTTSKEELQSLNEELLSVNSELQAKISELSVANSDLMNFLNNTDVGTVYLDNDLSIRRFNISVKKIINLIKSDVGRPLSDIITNFKSDSIIRDSQEVLESLVFKETQAQTKNDKWYMIRIYPYRTLENRIDGVVITFSDITAIKELESSLVESRNFAEAIVETVKDPLIVLDDELKIVTANQAFYSIFKMKSAETENRYIYEIAGGSWNASGLTEKLKSILSGNAGFENFLLVYDFLKIGSKKLKLNARLIVPKDNKKKFVLLAVEEY